MENISPALAKIAAVHPELRKAIEARLVTVTPDQKCIGISVEGIVAAERERCARIAESFDCDFGCDLSKLAAKIRMSE